MPGYSGRRRERHGRELRAHKMSTMSGSGQDKELQTGWTPKAPRMSISRSGQDENMEDTDLRSVESAHCLVDNADIDEVVVVEKSRAKSD